MDYNSFHLFVHTFALKLKGANYKSHWNNLAHCEQWNMISILTKCPMEKCLILFHFNYLGFLYSQNWEIFKAIELFQCFWWKTYDVRFECVLWKMSDFVSFPLLGFTFFMKLRKFNFKSHWICPIKQCLIWFKFCCLSSILVRSW